MVTALLEPPVLADVHEALLGRIDGNPLYAEQFVEY